MENKKEKFQAFRSIGLFAATVAISVASVSVIASAENNNQDNVNNQKLQENLSSEIHVPTVVNAINSNILEIRTKFIDNNSKVKSSNKTKSSI